MSMAFETDAEREAFFERTEGGNIEYGTAKRHAEATDLGLWGDKADLKYDCMRIFERELERYIREYNIEWPFSPCTSVVDLLAYSRVFELAFDTWRVEPDNRLEVALNAAGLQGDVFLRKAKTGFIGDVALCAEVLEELQLVEKQLVNAR